MDDIRDRIYPYIIDDPYYPLDYGFNTDTFLEAYDNAWGGITSSMELNPIYDEVKLFAAAAPTKSDISGN